MKYLVFDIETRVDKTLLRSIYYPEQALSDDEAFHRFRSRLLEEEGRDFIALTFHVPVCIAFARVGLDLHLEDIETLTVPAHSDRELAERFWEQVERTDATLVSFNGRGFDLPVMELQALRHGLQVPRYFNERNSARYRYSERHYDLHEFVSNWGAYRLRGGLDLLAKMIGLPGKIGVHGADVQGLWDTGRTDVIEQYCRRDVIQTYLLLVRLERLRGRLTQEQLDTLWLATDSLQRELVV
jgi:predicted PolB exonuclease-like 3'-5' exonuclease